MKLNTISGYILVYLLARGPWNLVVPVKADVESGGSRGSASGEGGSTGNGGGGDADSTAGSDASSTVAVPAANGGSTASSNEGSTAGEGSGVKAQVSSDSSSQASNDNDAGKTKAVPIILNGLYPDFYTSGVHILDEAIELDPGTKANSEEPKRSAEDLGCLYPDLFTGAISVDEPPKTNPELVAKRKDAQRLVDDAIRAGEEIIKLAKELAKAINEYGNVEDLTAKMDATAYQLTIEASKLHDCAKPPDMMYYSGFPDGWHFGNQESTDIRRYHLNLEAEKLRALIDENKKVVDEIKRCIEELTAKYNTVDSVIKNLQSEHNDLVKNILLIDAANFKIYKSDTDNNPVLMAENTDFDMKIDNGDFRFDFKSSVVCTLVKLGEIELWKTGDHGFNNPNYVIFNSGKKNIVLGESGSEVKYNYENQF